MSRGMTLVELMIGVAIISVLSLIIGLLLKTSMRVANYTLWKSSVLANSRKSLAGDFGVRGIIWGARRSVNVSILDPVLLTLIPPAPETPPNYVISIVPDANATGLSLSRGPRETLVHAVNAVKFDYYHIDPVTELIAIPATDAEATFLTADVTMQGAGILNSYSVFSGTGLRNHP